MKKLSLFAMLAAALSLSALSLSFSSPVQSLRGTVRIFGNSPFEYPGFQTEDDRQYTLEVAEGAAFTLDDMSAHAGELLELSGRLKKKKGGLASLSGGHIVVESYEIVAPLEENPGPAD